MRFESMPATMVALERKIAVRGCNSLEKYLPRINSNIDDCSWFLFLIWFTELVWVIHKW